MANKIFKHYTGTLEAFKAYVAGKTTEEQALLFGDSITFIHPDDSSNSGWLYANGEYYTALEMTGVTPESLFAVIDGDSIGVEIKNGKLKLTPVLLKPITTYTKVGYLEAKTALEAGTSLEEILQRILSTELDVTPSNPTAKITNSGTASGTFEVGTIVTPVLAATYTDGKFVPVDGWGDTINAGCTQGDTVYYRGNTALESGSDSYALPVGTTSYKATIAYGLSTTTPKTNYGNDSTKTIPAGTATSNVINFVGQYKYFIGYSENTAFDLFNSSSIRNLTAKTSYLNNSGNTSISDILTSNGTSIVIACPSTYKLTLIQNGVGASIIPNFSSVGNVTVNIGGNSTQTYKVYVYPITNGATVEFKNIIIAKN